MTKDKKDDDIGDELRNASRLPSFAFAGRRISATDSLAASLRSVGLRPTLADFALSGLEAWELIGSACKLKSFCTLCQSNKIGHLAITIKNSQNSKLPEFYFPYLHP